MCKVSAERGGLLPHFHPMAHMSHMHMLCCTPHILFSTNVTGHQVAQKSALQVNLCLLLYDNKTKVISADLLDLDFDFEDIIMFGNISVLLTFQYW